MWKMPRASQEKVRPNPAGTFPRDTCWALNGSELLIESVQRVSSPISALTWAVDLPDGLFSTVIRVVDEKKPRGGGSGCQLGGAPLEIIRTAD